MLGSWVQFRGVENAALVTALAAAIAASVLGYGLWQLLVRRRRRGAGAVLAGGVSGGLVILAAIRVPLDAPAGRVFWLVLMAALIALAVGVFYSAVYAYLGRRRMAALLALRFAAILALLLILFKPAVSLRPGPAGAKLALPVLLDRSASMNTIDHADLPDRYRQSVEALSAQARRLGENFRVGWYHFAEQVQAVEAVEELVALDVAEPQAGTDLAAAIRRAAGKHSAEELAGIVLISDGVHNAAGGAVAPADAAAESPVPIYVIGVGSEGRQASGRRNVRVLTAGAPMEAILNNVNTVTARVELTAWANVSTKVALTEDGREVASRQVLADSNAQVVEVKLDWTPAEPPAGAEGPDARRLRVLVQPDPAETTPDDNAAELHVLVGRPSIRVLYVEGTLRPEFKFLRRALATDPNLQVLSLVRVQENRFRAQGSIDGRQLTDLPATAEQLDFFDVLILGDLDRTFLTDEQMRQIGQFVSEGKALLMLGGRSSFGPGGYGGTPVESALPVFCGGRGEGQETTRFLPHLTAAGVSSPIFAGLERHFHGPSGKAGEPLPQLLGCVRVPKAKPHATVLAVHPTRRNSEGSAPLVVLALHNYGKGRAAAFTADTTWRWFMRLSAAGAANPYHRFWGQLVRHLAGVEEKGRRQGPSLLARLDRPYLRQGEELKIAARVRDAAGKPAEEVNVSAWLRADPAREPVQVVLAGSPAGEGLYQGSYRPQQPGKYTVAVTAVDKQGTKIAEDDLPVTVAPYAKETERLARDGQTLKDVAQRSKGRYAELSRLPDVIDEILQRQRSRLLPPRPVREYPLYDFTLLFLLFVGLLSAEWLIRRSWQLQ